MFNKKNILITGGTGSFGNEFADHLLKNYKCNKVIIFSRDELKQHNMRLKLSKFQNLRFLLMEYYQKWDLMNRSEVIQDMYDDKSNILIEKFEELESSNIDKNTLKKFRRFINKQDDDDIKNKIKEEIKLLLYNNKNNINK